MAQLNRTIICLAAKRSGTTAIHQVFVNHPQVQVIHHDQNIDNIESNFWNYAMLAMTEPDHIQYDKKTNYERFVHQMSTVAPYLSIPQTLTEEQIFDLYDQIANHHSPILFDKSPGYLSDLRTLELIFKYKDSGRGDIRFFGLIRAPWDVITSQYELWNRSYTPGTPQIREQNWLRYYKHFEHVQNHYSEEHVPLFYYEQVANDPKTYISHLFEHSGVEHLPHTYRHFRPVSIGRYYKTLNRNLLKWQLTPELLSYATQHGYQLLPSQEIYKIRIRAFFQRLIQLPQRVLRKLSKLISINNK